MLLLTSFPLNGLKTWQTGGQRVPWIATVCGLSMTNSAIINEWSWKMRAQFQLWYLEKRNWVYFAVVQFLCSFSSLYIKLHWEKKVLLLLHLLGNKWQNYSISLSKHRYRKKTFWRIDLGGFANRAYWHLGHDGLLCLLAGFVLFSWWSVQAGFRLAGFGLLILLLPHPDFWDYSMCYHA